MEEKIFEWMKMRLYERSHSLSLALGILKPEVGEETASMGADGWRLYINGAWLREAFLADSEALCRLFLHVLCHCMLGHPFRFWQERTRAGLSRRESPGKGIPVEAFKGQREGKILSETELLRIWEDEAWELLDTILGRDGRPREKSGEAAVRGGSFVNMQDDHSLWGKKPLVLEKDIPGLGPGGGKKGWGEEESLEKSRKWEQAYRALIRDRDSRQRAGNRQMSVIRSLTLTEEKRYSYRVFLKQFACLREEGGLDMEQFDYGLYFRGLSWYGNIPLIEPLEYRERQKIGDLVIVIDTSGSCGEELVRMFLEETRNILKEEALFFRRFCLHILQCDNRVQRDDRVTCQEELDAYLEDLFVVGGGGTDFRPAFSRIEELRREELYRLKGVLYFTDGYGIYPAAEPDYKVAFVFLKYRYDDIDVPVWAEKLVLDAKRPGGVK